MVQVDRFILIQTQVVLTPSLTRDIGLINPNMQFFLRKEYLKASFMTATTTTDTTSGHCSTFSTSRTTIRFTYPTSNTSSVEDMLTR